MLPPFVSPIPTALKAPTVITKSRDEIARIAPQIDEMMIDAETALKKTPGSIKPAAGCTVSSIYVCAAIGEFLSSNRIPNERVCPRTILIELPSQFERAIATMAVQKPQLLNCESTCLLGRLTYLEWECGLTAQDNSQEEQRPTHLWVPERDLKEEMYQALNMLDEAIESERWCWQPVILVCGASVAIGGFALDESLDDALHLGMYGAVNFNPYLIYTEEEMANAALVATRFGRTPWFDGYWQSEESQILGVRLLRCNTPFDEDRFCN